MPDERTPTIIVDHREPDAIKALLLELGTDVQEAALDVGDYVCAENIAVERKAGLDLVNSIKDGRLFEQLTRLKDTYETAVLVMENFLDIFEDTGMRKSSIYGALLSVAINMQVILMPSAGYEDSAIIVHRLAYRAQIKEHHAVLSRKAPKGMDLEARREYIIEGLPNTGPVIAHKLLERFRTPYEVFEAIKQTKIVFTRTGRPKGIEGPLEEVEGISHKRLLELKKALFAIEEAPESQIMERESQNDDEEFARTG